MARYYFLYWLVFVVMTACQSNPETTTNTNEDALSRSLRLAGNNRVELEKVLAHYRQHTADSLKLKAALLLISNIDSKVSYTGQWLTQFDSLFEQSATLSEDQLLDLKNKTYARIGTVQKASLSTQYDIQQLKASYLIENIDLAFEAWQQAPWHKSVSFQTFCNFILPYKGFSEYPESWRASLRKNYEYLLRNTKRDSAMIKICCQLNDELKIKFRYTDHLNDYPGRISVSNLLKGQRGNCSDMANLAAYTSRSLGLPVAIDYTPQWGNYHDGHVWNALIVNNHESNHFMGTEGNIIEYAPFFKRTEFKLAKAYRKLLMINDSSFVRQAERLGIKNVPLNLQTSRILDVTELYATTSTVTLSVDAPDNTPVYLGLFQNGNWQAIEGGFVQNQKVTFQKIGVNIVYMPLYYEDQKYKIAGDPFLLTLDKKIQTIKADDDQTQTVALYRKYPLKRERANWSLAQYLYKCRIEASNSPDFKEATILATADNTFEKLGIKDNGGAAARDRMEYESLWQEALIKHTKPFRYLRFISFNEPNNPIKIGELAVFEANSTTPLKGNPIGTEQHPEWAFDGVHGQSVVGSVPNNKGQWVGIDLGKPTLIGKVRYLPANDKNIILPDKSYELFYWNQRWISLGRQQSNNFSLQFKNAPSEALFLLHCYNCKSAEERPFTYQNGKQIWW